MAFHRQLSPDRFHCGDGDQPLVDNRIHLVFLNQENGKTGMDVIQNPASRMIVTSHRLFQFS
jgi:hypothetical protein